MLHDHLSDLVLSTLSFTGSVDLLQAVNLDQEQLGVERVVGFCDNRASSGVPDVAYRLSEEATMSVSSFEVFPGKKMSWISRIFPWIVPYDHVQTER